LTTPTRSPRSLAAADCGGVHVPWSICCRRPRRLATRRRPTFFGVTIPWQAHRLTPGRARDPEGLTFVEILGLCEFATYHASWARLVWRQDALACVTKTTGLSRNTRGGRSIRRNQALRLAPTSLPSASALASGQGATPLRNDPAPYPAGSRL
jgi:hypothetical protein